MNITTEAFKKAAKRLAAKCGCSLAAAQQTLAETFGFGNLDAALKALAAPPPANLSLSEPELTGERYPRELTQKGEFRLRMVDGQADSWLTNDAFAVGSATLLSALVKDLFASDEVSTWTQQADAFVDALMRPLVYLRNLHSVELDLTVVRDYLWMDRLEDLAWSSGTKYPGLDESGALDGLREYLLNKPGYKIDRLHNQCDTAQEQHGYVTMQMCRRINSLCDTYGLSHLVVVSLPPFNGANVHNLGKMVIAGIKANMGQRLGRSLETKPPPEAQDGHRSGF